MKDQKVHIAVDEHFEKDVEKELEEWKRKTVFEYQMDKPVESYCRMNVDIRPGSQLLTGASFRFCGTMMDKETGVTVGHGVNQYQDVCLKKDSQEPPIIGRCIDAYRDVYTEGTQERTTADMAILRLQPDSHLDRNFVHYGDKQFRVKIHRGIIPNNTEVMVLDQERNRQEGVIVRKGFIDNRLYRRHGNACAKSVQCVGDSKKRRACLCKNYQSW